MHFDSTVNLPGLVGFLVILVSVVAGFVRLEERVATLRERQAEHESEDDKRWQRLELLHENLRSRHEALALDIAAGRAGAPRRSS